jgi:hypothetical protein
MAQVADAVEELDEPAMCKCGRHYVGASCGVARRVKIQQARRHFEAGGEVLVSEYGHEESRGVWLDTTTHSSSTTTWDALAEMVREWRGRYPNQRYYIVERY